MSKSKYQARPGKALAVQPRASIAPVQQQSDTALTIIARAVENGNLPVETMRGLFELQKDFEKSEAVKAFNAAFAQMQRFMPRVVKRGVIPRNSGPGVPFGRWEDIDEVTRPILVEHGFSLSFATYLTDAGKMIMRCTLAHTMGHSIFSEEEVKPEKPPGTNEAQARGSGRSYTKKYLAKDLLNIVTVDEDDDAQSTDKKITTEQVEWTMKAIKAESIDADKFHAFIKERFGALTIADIPFEGLKEVEAMINTRQRTNKHDITKAPR